MKKRAFTLVELIIVLAIISIAFGIAVVKFSVVEKIGSRNEIQTFINDYSYLRDLSLSSGTDYSIIFTENGYRIEGQKIKVRDLKYVKSLNISAIHFKSNGYVTADKTKAGHNLVFVSGKDQETKRLFTIEAVGGYLSEKN